MTTTAVTDIPTTSRRIGWRCARSGSRRSRRRHWDGQGVLDRVPAQRHGGGHEAVRGGSNNPFAGVTNVDDLPFAVPDELIATRIEAQPFAAAKMPAVRAHATQGSQRTRGCSHWPRASGRNFLGIEYYEPRLEVVDPATARTGGRRICSSGRRAVTLAAQDGPDPPAPWLRRVIVPAAFPCGVWLGVLGAFHHLRHRAGADRRLAAIVVLAVVVEAALLPGRRRAGVLVPPRLAGCDDGAGGRDTGQRRGSPRPGGVLCLPGRRCRRPEHCRDPATSTAASGSCVSCVERD